jgi:hypothetical protein
MSNNQKSYPDRIRRIAGDIESAVSRGEYDFAANKLRELANELEEKLKQEIPKEA